LPISIDAAAGAALRLVAGCSEARSPLHSTPFTVRPNSYNVFRVISANAIT